MNPSSRFRWPDKYIGTFLPLLPAGTTVDQFKPVFITVFKNDAILRNKTIEKWDGQLPRVTAGEGSTPMISVPME